MSIILHTNPIAIISPNQRLLFFIFLIFKTAMKKYKPTIILKETYGTISSVCGFMPNVSSGDFINIKIEYAIKRIKNIIQTDLK